MTGPKGGAGRPGHREALQGRGSRWPGHRTRQNSTGQGHPPGVFIRPPGRRDHSGKRPRERPLGPLTRDAGPLASDGVPRERAAQRKDWWPSPENGGRQADGGRPVRPQHRWGEGRHSLCAGCEGCAVTAERHRPLRRSRRTGAEA
jgi:hypothetical protein